MKRILLAQLTLHVSRYWRSPAVGSSALAASGSGLFHQSTRGGSSDGRPSRFGAPATGKRYLGGPPSNEDREPTRSKIGRDESSTSTTTTARQSSRSSSIADSTPATKAQWSILQSVQRGCGNVMMAVGFGVSSAISLYSNRNQFKPLEKSMVAMETFLKESRIDGEITKVLSSNLLDHIVILGRIQQILLRGQDPRSIMTARSGLRGASSPSMEDAYRYSRYAVAVYGDSVIQASKMDASGDIDVRLFGDEEEISRDRVATHIGVDAQDIALLDVSYSGSAKHLRHFVALDHEKKKVVLAIRGTFSLSEIIVDVAAFSRPFCGGQAHAEMATAAEKIWEATGPTVVKLLEQDPQYELVICGHSLGAGTAALLNIMCHQNNRKLVLHRPIHCFTYAACPVFEPLEAARDAVKATTNYIHGSDVVPFLSLDSVRHTLASLATIAESTKKLDFVTRMRVVMGYKDPSPDLVNEVSIARKGVMEPKQGAPPLFIPAANNVWLREMGKDEFNVQNVDSKRMAAFGIHIHPSMMLDHFPRRYEHSLQRMVDSAPASRD